MKKLNFDEKKHQYTHPDGHNLISITTFLSGSEIDPYPKEEKSPELVEIIKKAGERGTLIHKLIENDINGVKNDGEYEDIILKYYQAYLNFKKAYPELISNISYSEKQVYNNKFAGTIDVVGNNFLLDWKTTSTLHYELVDYQLNGYYKLLNDINITFLIVVQLKKSGAFELNIFRPDKNKQNFFK